MSSTDLKRCSWYDGPSLLELLESLPSSRENSTAPFRFPVQRVLRPDHTFRGFAGQIASGTVAPGDKITVLPSGRIAEVARIVTFDGELAEARAPLSVTLVLDRELDISRGDLIVSSQAPAVVSKSLKAALVWMDRVLSSAIAAICSSTPARPCLHLSPRSITAPTSPRSRTNPPARWR